MTRFRFSLSLSSDEFLKYYRGAANAVIVRTDDARTLQLPAARLRPFLLQDGVHGRFEITLGDDNRLLDLRRISG